MIKHKVYLVGAEYTVYRPLSVVSFCDVLSVCTSLKSALDIKDVLKQIDMSDYKNFKIVTQKMFIKECFVDDTIFNHITHKEEK